jgi:hypothetical protein
MTRDKRIENMGLDDKVIEERTGLGPQGTKGLITGVWMTR